MMEVIGVVMQVAVVMGTDIYCLLCDRRGMQHFHGSSLLIFIPPW